MLFDFYLRVELYLNAASTSATEKRVRKQEQW